MGAAAREVVGGDPGALSCSCPQPMAARLQVALPRAVADHSRLSLLGTNPARRSPGAWHPPHPGQAPAGGPRLRACRGGMRQHGTVDRAATKRASCARPPASAHLPSLPPTAFLLPAAVDKLCCCRWGWMSGPLPPRACLLPPVVLSSPRACVPQCSALCCRSNTMHSRRFVAAVTRAGPGRRDKVTALTSPRAVAALHAAGTAAGL